MGKTKLHIEDIGAQGDGIAHYDGKTIFVAGTLPDEKINAEMIGKGRATIIDIENPNPERITPPCPHFGVCGGCKLQHLSETYYAKFKTEQLRKTLESAAIPLPEFAETIITPPQSRRRARLVARHMKSGLVLGFNETRSHHIVDIKDCPLLHPKLLQLIPIIREQLPNWLPLNKACDIQLTLLPNGIDMVLIGGPLLDLKNREKLGAIAQQLSLARLSWRQNDRGEIEPLFSAGQLTVSFGTRILPFPSDTFLQASDVGEKALTYFVHKYVKPDMRVLDLFCGLGTFGLSLNGYKQLLMADNDGPATAILEHVLKDTARANVEKRNLFKEPFSAFECNDFDCVIFDPPRAGAKEQCEELAKSDVPLIIAISCNTQSFARDAAILVNGGYKITALQPVDQFLWSTHMELAAVWER